MGSLRAIAIFLLCALPAFGQNVRFDNPTGPVLGTNGRPIANPIITVCTSTATGTPCSPQATTYADATLSTPCSSGSQVTLTNSNICQGTGDSSGNFGFWLPPGTYKFSITAPSVIGALYTLTVPAFVSSGPTFKGVSYPSIAACYAAIPAASFSACGDGVGSCWTGGGGICEVPTGWIDPVWTQNLVLATDKSIYFHGPAYINQSTFQVIAPGGLAGVSIVNLAYDHSQRTSGVTFDYSGSSDQWVIGDGVTGVSNLILKGLQLHAIGGGNAVNVLHLHGPAYSSFEDLDLVCANNASNTGNGLLVDGPNPSQDRFDGTTINFCNNPTVLIGLSNSIFTRELLGNPKGTGGPAYSISSSNENTFINNSLLTGTFASFYNLSGTSSGNQFLNYHAGQATTDVIFGASTTGNIFQCNGAACTITDSSPGNAGNILRGNASDTTGYVFKAAQTSAIGSTTILTSAASVTQYYVTASLACDSASAGATVSVTIGYTDVSNTAQSILSASANCAVLGGSSTNSISFPFMPKANTAITYLTTIANTPTYDLRIAVTQTSPTPK